MKRAYTLGGIYFWIHFLLEVTSYYILTSVTHDPNVWILLLIYDFTAFVPQGLFGYLRDLGIRINFAAIGTALTTLALVLTAFDCNMFLTITVLSIGNCLVHAHGAEITLRSSPGKITPGATFVSGGSFGVVTGKLLSVSQVHIAWVFGLAVLSFVLIFIAERLKDPDGSDNLRLYRFDNPKLGTAMVIGLALFAVAVRAFMGYGIPTLWNKTMLQTVVLFFFMGAGKLLGGVLTDAVGVRKTTVISTLGAVPFLLLGADMMYVSVIGVAIFNMTMAVTLAILVSRMPNRPGVAFGITTIGLFMGTLPMFFFRISSALINSFLVILLSILCMVVLYAIGAKLKTQNNKE